MVDLLKNKNIGKWGIGVLVVSALGWWGVSYSSAKSE